MARRSKKQAGTGSPADDVQLVADFVRRLRRVALHPLALDEYGTGRPGSYLCRLVTHLGTVELGPDHTATVRLELPDEVQFESLATRLRSFTIDSDRLFWRDALDALDRLTGLEDRLLKEASQWYRQAWGKATERDTPNERAYRTGYRVGDDEDGEEQHFTDIDMAYAWLYQDVAHGDEVSTGYFDVTERYRAAVQVFSHMAWSPSRLCTTSTIWVRGASWSCRSAPSPIPWWCGIVSTPSRCITSTPRSTQTSVCWTTWCPITSSLLWSLPR